MAQYVGIQQEKNIPEYEILEKYNILKKDELRALIEKRNHFLYKLRGNSKSAQIYYEFINHEKKFLALIEEAKGVPETTLKSIKVLVTQRIINFHQKSVQDFPEEIRLWNTYIQFCKNNMQNLVSEIYDKFVEVGPADNKDNIMCDAILWEQERGSSQDRITQMCLRACGRYPASEIIYLTFFCILLEHTYKMTFGRTPINRTQSKQSTGLEGLIQVYKTAKDNIPRLSFLLQLLGKCEEEKYKCFSAEVQKHILEDLTNVYFRNEELWDALAQRELNGFCAKDLKKFTPVNNLKSEPGTSDITNTEVDREDVKDPSIIKNIRPLRQRIEFCVQTYELAIQTLKTPLMMSMYIDAMLKLNQDTLEEFAYKQQCLMNAFKEGHSQRLLTEEHYVTLVKIFMQHQKTYSLAEKILPTATNLHNSVQLHQIWLSLFIKKNNERMFNKMFRSALKKFKDEETIPLWTMALQYYQTNYVKHVSTLQQLFKEACRHTCQQFGIFRVQYINWCSINLNMEKTRTQYDTLTKFPPPCLELHKRMAEIESYAVKTNTERWRLCHSNATNLFGKTNEEVWIEYIKFERDHGNPMNMTKIFERARNTLQPNIVERFITTYNLSIMGI